MHFGYLARTRVQFSPSPRVQKTAHPLGWAFFVRGDGASKLLCLRRELKVGVCCEATTRQSREYLDFYERSEIKSLVTHDQSRHLHQI